MARSAVRWVSVSGGACATRCAMCVVRLSGLGRGDGSAGVVRAWSRVAGPAGGVVMAGVLAHHLLVVGAVGIVL